MPVAPTVSCSCERSPNAYASFYPPVISYTYGRKNKLQSSGRRIANQIRLILYAHTWGTFPFYKAPILTPRCPVEDRGGPISVCWSLVGVFCASCSGRMLWICLDSLGPCQNASRHFRIIRPYEIGRMDAHCTSEDMLAALAKHSTVGGRFIRAPAVLMRRQGDFTQDFNVATSMAARLHVSCGPGRIFIQAINNRYGQYSFV